MSARTLASVTLLLVACGRSTPSPAVTAAPIEAPDTAVAAAPDPGEDTVALTRDTVAVDPPLVAEPAATAWTVDLVPAPVRDDAGARRFIAEVAGDGLAAHVDASLGVVWDQAGTPERLGKDKDKDELGRVAPALEAALRSGGGEARCRGGICLVAAGEARWFLLVRRTSAPRRLVAGVLRAETWPSARRYATWADQTHATWLAAAPSLIGDALSSEEAGYYEQAYEKFARAYAATPDNPWPLYYMARARVAMKQYRAAYVDFRRLCEHPSPLALRAQLKLGSDEEMARFRTHSAVAAVQAELELPAPDAPAPFAEWLRRFRGIEERLAPLIAEGGPSPSAVAALLEAHLLDVTAASDTRLGWTGAALILRRNALGALEITGIEESPGSAPPE